MGEYYGVRFKAKLNTRGLEIVKLLEETKSEEVDPWKYVVTHALSPIDLHGFQNLDRSMFIPFGYPQDMPPDWKPSAKLRMMRNRGEWTWEVCCALKTEPTLWHFLQFALPQIIAEPCVVQLFHEEWLRPKMDLVKPGPQHTLRIF